MNIHAFIKKWLHLIIVVSAIGIVGVLLLYIIPDKCQLILFGLYTIPSHMFPISPFPHEPPLLYCAKFYPPWAITIAATIGCCLAGLFDYWTLVPLFNHHTIRPKFENNRIFKKSLAFFHKSPFWMLVIAGYTPIPFFPFKLLSITSGYPLWKYEMALLVGRTPRYYTLAWLGYVVQPPNWTLILFMVILVLMFIKSAFKR